MFTSKSIYTHIYVCVSWQLMSTTDSSWEWLYEYINWTIKKKFQHNSTDRKFDKQVDDLLYEF